MFPDRLNLYFLSRFLMLLRNDKLQQLHVFPLLLDPVLLVEVLNRLESMTIGANDLVCQNTLIVIDGALCHQQIKIFRLSVAQRFEHFSQSL
jgi:hypothetical protein